MPYMHNHPIGHFRCVGPRQGVVRRWRVLKKGELLAALGRSGGPGVSWSHRRGWLDIIGFRWIITTIYCWWKPFFPSLDLSWWNLTGSEGALPVFTIYIYCHTYTTPPPRTTPPPSHHGGTPPPHHEREGQYHTPTTPQLVSGGIATLDYIYVYTYINRVSTCRLWYGDRFDSIPWSGRPI